MDVAILVDSLVTVGKLCDYKVEEKDYIDDQERVEIDCPHEMTNRLLKKLQVIITNRSSE